MTAGWAAIGFALLTFFNRLLEIVKTFRHRKYADQANMARQKAQDLDLLATAVKARRKIRNAQKNTPPNSGGDSDHSGSDRVQHDKYRRD